MRAFHYISKHKDTNSPRNKNEEQQKKLKKNA